MPRTLTSDQLSNVLADAVWPIVLVQLNHSGTLEYLSCSGDVTYDSQAYTGGGCSVRSIVDSTSATLVLTPSPSRAEEIQSGVWRGGTCVIYYIPALPSDSSTFVAADGVLMLDGLIDTSSIKGEAHTITAKNKYLTGRMGPGYIVNEVASSAYLPAPGDSLEWEGETVSYEQWILTTRNIGALRG